MDNLKGIELLFLLTRDQFTCEEDCLVALFHCLMINNGKKCIGIGYEWTETSSDEATEALPAGWNSGHVYCLRYLSNDSPPGRYLMKIVKAGQCLMVNVLDVKKEKAAGMSVDVTNHVSENYKEYKNAYVNSAELCIRFQNEVVTVLNKDLEEKGNVHLNTEKADSSMKKERMRDPEPRIPERVRLDEERHFPSIGRGDLDPFSGGTGGGMLADPSSFRSPPRSGMPGFGAFDPYGIPRGSVPPGARFDPIGPLGPGRGSHPDPDHLPPPGYDDMFM